MRKDIKALLANIIKYTIIPVVVTWIVCFVSLRKDSNPQPPTNLEDSEDMVLHDSSDDTEDWVLSDTSRIADSAFVVYDKKYEVTTMVIEGLLDKKDMAGCKQLIVEEEAIDHILICPFRYDYAFVKQVNELQNFMSEYRENIMEEANSFMMIR